ncbi:MAG: FAD-dependent monooxygenase, partial [Anaerolineales bacterium]
MRPSDRDYDVIIIGGRVAGAILASLLGDRGHRVLVLDRATFPSDTLSTHFFRAPALRAFSEIGVYDEVQSAAPHLTVNYNVIDGDVFPEPVDRPEDYPFYMCVRRITLDDILVRRAKETSNVELLEGAVANALLSEEGRISGVAWKASGEVLQASAKVVVGADGVRSFVAKEVGVEIEQEEPVRRAMYYAYFRGVEANEGPAAEFH